MKCPATYVTLLSATTPPSQIQYCLLLGLPSLAPSQPMFTLLSFQMAIWHMPSFFTQCQFLLHDPDTHISGMYVIQKPIVSMRASTISNPGIYFFSKSSSPIASSKNASMLSLLVILNHCRESPCRWRKMQQST